MSEMNVERSAVHSERAEQLLQNYRRVPGVPVPRADHSAVRTEASAVQLVTVTKFFPLRCGGAAGWVSSSVRADQEASRRLVSLPPTAPSVSAAPHWAHRSAADEQGEVCGQVRLQRAFGGPPLLADALAKGMRKPNSPALRRGRRPHPRRRSRVLTCLVQVSLAEIWRRLATQRGARGGASAPSCWSWWSASRITSICAAAV